MSKEQHQQYTRDTPAYATPLSSQDNCEARPYHDPLCPFMRPQDPRKWLHILTLTLRPP